MRISLGFFSIIILGYLIGYYWRTPGNVTVGRLYPA